MLDFAPVKPQDRLRIQNYLNISKPICCDFTFGNIYAWSCLENTEFCIKDDFLFMRSTFGGVTSYAVPFGDGDKKKALAVIENDAKERGVKVDFYSVCPRAAEFLLETYGSRIILSEKRQYFDYIYSREGLATLSGRKYHSKKNHFNSFTKSYDYSYEELNDKNLSECLEFSHKWHDENEKTPGLIIEREVIDRAFEHFFELGLSGALIRIDGEIAAYTVGERSNVKDTYCTHFEKASSKYPAAYTAINKLFAENSLSEYKYINREDDAGSDGLRQAKLSYHPELLLKKYYAELTV